MEQKVFTEENCTYKIHPAEIKLFRVAAVKCEVSRFFFDKVKKFLQYPLVCMSLLDFQRKRREDQINIVCEK